MAELSQPGAAENAVGKIRAKKAINKNRYDPMVDLAFLLLTFFILTTRFLKPHIMPLTMPEPVEDPSRLSLLKASNAFSIVLGEDNKIYWWIGLKAPASPTNYSKEGIRKILLEQSKANPDLMVFIKPMDKSRYENMVDILDEVAIADITRYAIVEVTEEDRGKVPSERSLIRK